MRVSVRRLRVEQPVCCLRGFYGKINVANWRCTNKGTANSMRTESWAQISRTIGDSRNVMLYWDDANPFPPDIIAITEKWRNFCPGWDVMLFGKDTACGFLQENFGRDIARLFLTCGLSNMRSDFFRVFWAIAKGGIYSDLLFSPKREPLFFDPEKNLTLARNHYTGMPINGIFFAKRDCVELKLVAYQLITTISKSNYSGQIHTSGKTIYLLDNIQEKWHNLGCGLLG